MELRRAEITESPADGRRMRLRGEVVYDGGSGAAEEYWFDVGSEYAEGLSVSGNVWLACLAPLAGALGEPLRLDLPVDPTLLAGVRELLRIWSAWYPGMRDVPVEAPEDDGGPLHPGRRTASFFSGGVDSFFTVLRHANGLGVPRSYWIDDLVFIRGFDIPLRNAAGAGRAEAALRGAALDLAKPLVTVATNLRETRFAMADWEHVSHGAALAAVGLALERRYGRVLIPSSAGYRDLRFWGSHPITDRLFSTAGTEIVHDGAAFMRVEKTEYVAQFDVALRVLRVCWRSGSAENCSMCNNCYRTMLTLEVLGVLDRCLTFDRSRLDLARAARIYCPNSWDVRQFGYVHALARRWRRDDIARAVERSLRRSPRLTRRLRVVHRLRAVPLLHRLVPALERRVVAGWIV